MKKKIAVLLMLTAFGFAQVAPVAAQTSSSTPAQTSPKKKSTTAKKKTPAKKSTAPKKKTTKTAKPKTSSFSQTQAVG